jgi:hypothetical protein
VEGEGDGGELMEEDASLLAEDKELEDDELEEGGREKGGQFAWCRLEGRRGQGIAAFTIHVVLLLYPVLIGFNKCILSVRMSGGGT